MQDGRCIYRIRNRATESRAITTDHREAGSIRIQAERKKLLLVLSGEPLNEPYVSYGPFVLKTDEEIRQCIEDYNAGEFGFLAD